MAGVLAPDPAPPLRLVHVSALGLGGIAPTAGWLRLLAPMEALVGFALLSGTVAWTLGIYPALAAAAPSPCGSRTSPAPTPPPSRSTRTPGAAIIDSLAAAGAVISVDFQQYAESSYFYFYDGDDRTSLACQITGAANLADQAAGARHPDVRLSAAVLRAALDDLAVTLDERFLRTGGTARQVCEAFARDHGRHSGVQ
ncbi:hypothetical protein [Streptomyces sp. H27-S2]|uniref:hypothetical protein n=1 Tax=Streptomyces antarcticus TaxID=2996458 RepID=UPI00226DD87C|nr:hypothetical protein [Streptomyces sp. H27-S2]MCY0955239.1 hypothetical protein [Streptomyces sp. H27-S2]